MDAEPDPSLSLEEQAVRWKLRQLDSNKNNVNNTIVVFLYRPSQTAAVGHGIPPFRLYTILRIRSKCTSPNSQRCAGPATVY